MKKNYLKIGIIMFMCISTMNAQTPIYEFTFDNTMSASIGTGTFSGSNTSFAADRFGNGNKALSKQSDLVTATLSNLPTGNSPRTISLWFKTSHSNFTYGIFYYGSDANLSRFGIYRSNGNFYFQAYGTDTQLDLSNITLTEWIHLAVTYDGSSVKTYFNGYLTNNILQNLTTGSDLPFTFGNMTGNIDDLKIYDVALSNAQIEELYLGSTNFNQIYEFPFNNSLSATVGTGTFSSGGSYSFVNDRNGTPNSALSKSTDLMTASLSNLPTGKSQRSISLWFNNTPSTNTFGLFYYGSDASLQRFGIYKMSGNYYFQGYASDFLLELSNVNINGWTHLVVTYDSTHVRTYFNNVLTNFINVNLNTGSDLPFTLDNMQGYIDDLKIFEGVLTNTQISQLYNSNIITSVSNNVYKKPIYFYPNPVKEKLFLDDLSGNSSIEIMDLQGKTIFSNEFQGVKAEIDFVNIPSGTYVIKIVNPEGVFTKKIVKE